MTIQFIADAYANNSALLQNLGTEHVLGGAEQDDLAMLSYLEKRVGPIKKILSRDLLKINPEDTYLLSNFAFMSEQVKQELIKHKNYVLYEHDHKYCRTRNPGLYKNFEVPAEQLTNQKFYKNARAVFCMTTLHKEILGKNVVANRVLLNGSFWTEEELDLIHALSNVEKNDRWFIYGNVSYHKGLQQGIDLAREQHLEYTVVPNQNTRKEFLTILSGHFGLIFCAMSPETCSRLTVEARMMNLQVIGSNMIGAFTEDWYREYVGTGLVDHMRNVLIPDAIDKIVEHIT